MIILLFVIIYFLIVFLNLIYYKKYIKFRIDDAVIYSLLWIIIIPIVILDNILKYIYKKI